MMGILEDLEERVKKLERALNVGVPYSDYIDQKQSVLGSKKHCAIVRRRVLAGDDGAVIVKKRRFLLSPEAYREEVKLDNAASGLTLPHPADNDDFYRDLMEKVGAQGVTSGSYPRSQS